MTDLCLDCSTFTLFSMGCSKGLKKICHGCFEAEVYRVCLRKEENKK